MPLYPNTRRPVSYQLFHGGASAYTLTPLTAGTVEPLNTPFWRTLADLSTVTQMRLVVGQRAIGAGGTTCELRLQYATNGATQSTWADAQATGTGLNLQAGTAATVGATGWVDLVIAARADNTYLRAAIVTTGTVTTAPTIATTAVQFR